VAILTYLLRHRRLFIVLHLLAAAVLLTGILQLRNDNSPEVFFTLEKKALQDYNRFCREFSDGKALRVALTGKGIWTTSGLSWIGKLEKNITLLPGVEAVVGPAAHHRWTMLEWPPPDPMAFRDRVLNQNHDLFAGWMSPDGETVTVLVIFSRVPRAAERELLERLNQLTANPPPGIRANFSGLPILHKAMDQSLIKMASRFLPLLFLVAVVFLAVVFRRTEDVVVLLMFVGVTQGILFGIMGYAGATVNLVNIIVAPLLFVISLATAVHIMLRFRALRQTGADIFQAVQETFRTKRWPVLWTGLTTMTAFGSLVTGVFPPLRSIGLWSALGIIIMTVLAFTFYPLLLASTRPQSSNKKLSSFETWTRHNGRRWAEAAVNHRIKIITATAILIAIALFGMARLTVSDNIAKYFPPHHPARAELERLQAAGVGVFSAELLLTLPIPDGYPGEYLNDDPDNNEDREEYGFFNPDAQLKLEKLSTILRKHPRVYGAVSSGDIVESSIRALLVEGKVSQGMRWMTLGMMQSAPESRKLLHTLVTENGQTARITLLVPMLSFNEIQPLFHQVEAEAKKIFPNTETRITGQYPLIITAQRKLLTSLLTAFSTTLLCVALIFLLLLKSIPLTLKVLLPNIWPVALVMGGMGLLEIPLDSASVMTASIVLGLVVDDTFHTLGYYRQAVKAQGPSKAIVTTLEKTAPAHILTSLILSAGFAVCTLSDLLPVSRMGTISAIAIAIALAADLIMIPSLLSKNRSG
jgi:uncharacterized protein